MSAIFTSTVPFIGFAATKFPSTFLTCHRKMVEKEFWHSDKNYNKTAAGVLLNIICITCIQQNFMDAIQGQNAPVVLVLVPVHYRYPVCSIRSFPRFVRHYLYLAAVSFERFGGISDEFGRALFCILAWLRPNGPDIKPKHTKKLTIRCSGICLVKTWKTAHCKRITSCCVKEHNKW